VRRALVAILAVAVAAVVTVAVSGGGAAHAAGLARPTVVGARSLGMGGAFTAVADDPTALWHNPAGPAFFGENMITLSGELVVTKRLYSPSPDSPLGQAGVTEVPESGGPAFVPTLGASTRFGAGPKKVAPSRFALSLLAYAANGGQIAFDKNSVRSSGLISTTINCFEIAPGLAYQISDVIALGVAVRIGISSFAVEDIEPTFKAQLDGRGVGIGASLGLLVRPHRMVSIGATYRTPLKAGIGGRGPVELAGIGTSERDFKLDVTWPQSASFGIAVRPHARLLASAQADWTAWSSIDRLRLEVSGLPASLSTRQMRYTDSFAVRLGVQAIAHRMVALRAGYTFDSNAIPDETSRRENQDGPKHLLAVGIGLHVWRLFLDAAFEALLPPVGGGGRTVPQTATVGLTEGGTYSAGLYTAALSGTIHF
jgi:long-chain fatty acid transport protein